MALITIQEAANMCCVDRQTILNWGEKGIITVKKLNKNTNKPYYANKEEIEAICQTSREISGIRKEIEALLVEAKNNRKEAKAKLMETRNQLRLINTVKVTRTTFDVLESIVSFICAVGIIKEREAQIVIMFINNKSIASIAETYGLTQTRILQIIAHAYRKMNNISKVTSTIKANEELKETLLAQEMELKMLRRKNEDLIDQLGIRHEMEEAKEREKRIAYLMKHDDTARLLNTPFIDESNGHSNTFELSVRVLNGLRYMDIEKVSDLVQMKKGDLLMCRNFGKKSIRELDDFLEDHGLEFGMDLNKIYDRLFDEYFNKKEC